MPQSSEDWYETVVDNDDWIEYSRDDYQASVDNDGEDGYDYEGVENDLDRFD